MSEKPTAQKRNVHDFLRFVVDKKASDLHVKAGGPPYVRMSGHLMKTDFPAMSSSDCERAAMDLMDESQAKGFKERGEIDFAYSEQGLGRFRVNVFRPAWQRGHRRCDASCPEALGSTPWACLHPSRRSRTSSGDSCWSRAPRRRARRPQRPR